VLLGLNKIDTGIIAQTPNFANDTEFAASLIEKGVLSKEEIEAVVITQIRQTLIDALSWPAGDWVFSPLARLRSDMIYDGAVYTVLIEYARCLPIETVSRRFKSVREAFVAVSDQSANVNLQLHESYVLSVFGGYQLTIEELRPLCSLPEPALLQALYVLWLGGVLLRQNWNAAFSPNKLNHIRSAKMSLVKEAARPVTSNTKEATIIEEPVEEPEKPAQIEISLQEYLQRVEKAKTHYDVMGVEANASVADIKATYFALARLFHPDRFHREAVADLRRIEVAFTSLAQAYETLKIAESRQSYDFKIRKELDLREKLRAEGIPDSSETSNVKAESGLDSFEQGLNLLMEEEFQAAGAFLARAIHYSPENALYHAYYGKALAGCGGQTHKAEAEMQTAAKLDPKNPKIRLMLAEFFIDMNLIKRAEGELTRFLEIAPNNREAQAMLAKIQQ
jgi:hypothetical protein